MKFNVIILAITLIVGCTVFEKEETPLAEHLQANGEKIGIYFVAVGATAQDNIQVRKLRGNKIIATFEKYNYLKRSYLVNDSTLHLIMSDTGYHKINQFDTLIVKLR
jgi:hypothetical protein